MSEIKLSTIKFKAEKYVENICSEKHLPNKLNSLSLEDKFYLDSYVQGYLFAYHSELLDALAEKGICLDELEP